MTSATNQALKQLIGPLLQDNGQLNALLALRATSKAQERSFTELIMQMVNKTLRAPYLLTTWNQVKLAIILKSSHQLDHAGGSLLFTGATHHAAELVAMWLQHDYLCDVNGKLYAWDNSTTLWKPVARFTELHTVLKAILRTGNYVADRKHRTCLERLFKRLDSNMDAFHAEFAAKCQTEQRLLQCTHRMPIQGNAILDLKKQKIWHRKKQHYCTFELPITNATAMRAIKLAKEKEQGDNNNTTTDSISSTTNTNNANANADSRTFTPFKRFVFQLMCGRLDMIDYLQRSVGSMVAGDIAAKKGLTLNIGRRNSGKTTFWEMVMEVFQPYFLTIVDRTLMNNGAKANHETEMQHFGGFAPVLFVDEGPRNYSLNREKVNRILGSSSATIRIARATDTQTVALRKHIVMVANHGPQHTDTDTTEKINTIPYDAQFVGSGNDQDEKGPYIYPEDKGFQATFLARAKNRAELQLFVLVGAMNYWYPTNSANTNAHIERANRKCFGVTRKRNRPYESQMEEFTQKMVKLEPLEDLDYAGFTKTEDVYAKFKELYPDYPLPMSEFGKDLAAFLPAYKAKPTRTNGKVCNGFHFKL